MIARLSRIIPLIIILAIVAAIVYLVATWRYSPNKAKEILIRVFTWFTGILSAALALICVYVLLDGNWAVFELTAFGDGAHRPGHHGHLPCGVRAPSSQLQEEGPKGRAPRRTGRKTPSVEAGFVPLARFLHDPDCLRHSGCARSGASCGIQQSTGLLNIGSNPLEPKAKRAWRVARPECSPWRRSGDSNPGYPCGVYSLSRRAPSASRSLLRTIMVRLPMIP